MFPLSLRTSFKLTTLNQPYSITYPRTIIVSQLSHPRHFLFSSEKQKNYLLTKNSLYVTVQSMNKLIIILTIVLLICPGCATLTKKSSQLTHGLTQAEIIKLWGNPDEKIKAGMTEKNYPVEIWAYNKNGIPLFKKEETCVLIFVDEELYSWAVNKPEFVFEELAKLGVIKPDAAELGFTQYQNSLLKSATEAEQTRKTMEVIQTYKFFKETQTQIQNMNQMRMLQQQQFQPPASVKPAQPIQPAQQK